MKIAIISDLWLPFPGGAERYIYNIACEMIKRGHEIHVLTSYGPALCMVNNQPVSINLTIKDVGVFERHAHGWGVITRYLDDVRPDVILTHHFFAGEFPELFHIGIPVVELIHSRPRTPAASLAIFNSNYTANAPGQLRLPGDMVILPYAGPDIVAQEHGDCIGHIKPIGGKGIRLTYDLARFFPERKFLVLRGEWQGGETIENLPNIEFMEPVKDIRTFYRRCRMILMPSEREEAGTVPQECALNGIPCVSSDAMGLPETNAGGIIININWVQAPGEQYLIHNESCVRTWAHAIQKLDDPDYYSRIVAREQAHVASIPWAKLFDELDSKIRRLM